MCVAPTAVEVLVSVAELEREADEAVVELCAKAEPNKAVASTAAMRKNIAKIVVDVPFRQLILA